MKNKMKNRMKNNFQSQKRVKLKLDYQISNIMIDTCDLKLHGIHFKRHVHKRETMRFRGTCI